MSHSVEVSYKAVLLFRFYNRGVKLGKVERNSGQASNLFVFSVLFSTNSAT